MSAMGVVGKCYGCVLWVSAMGFSAVGFSAVGERCVRCALCAK